METIEKAVVLMPTPEEAALAAKLELAVPGSEKYNRLHKELFRLIRKTNKTFAAREE